MNIKSNQFYVLLSIFLLTVMASIVADTIQQKNHSKTFIQQNQSRMKTIIVDVRTPREWQLDGHADCSVNYPLDDLEAHIEALKAYDKVVLVCRSGGRASYAQQILQQAGIKNVENLGAWQNVKCSQ